MGEFNILDVFILDSNSKLLLCDENLYAFVLGPTHFLGDDNCSKPAFTRGTTDAVLSSEALQMAHSTG